MRFLRVFWDISLSFGIKPAISGLLIAGLMYLYAEIWKFCGLLIKPKKMKGKVTSVIKIHQLKQILVLEQILERIQRNIRSQFFFFFWFQFWKKWKFTNHHLISKCFKQVLMKFAYLISGGILSIFFWEQISSTINFTFSKSLG